jgi:hypothetical protein
MLLSAFRSAVLNLFSKNMSTAVENFQVKQCFATIMHVEMLRSTINWIHVTVLFELLNQLSNSLDSASYNSITYWSTILLLL